MRRFACTFCGYIGDSTTLDAAHLYEREEFSAVRKIEGFQLLLSFDLGDTEEEARTEPDSM
jgi:hypothetical protein